MDLKIFVDTDADIRLMRRMRRDMEERGRTFAQVREQYSKPCGHARRVRRAVEALRDLIVPEVAESARARCDRGRLLQTLTAS